MRVECPSCGASGRIDASKRPAGAASIRCPRCGGSIALDAVAGTAEPAGAEPVKAEPAEAPVPPLQAPSVPIPPLVEPSVTNYCSVCNNPFPREDMVRFGPSLVCAACKPTYVQMLEQGAGQPGSFRYGGFWIRFAAKFIDGIIMTVVYLACSFLFTMLLVSSRNPASAIIAAALSALFYFAFAVSMNTWFLGRFGATPGKMAVGLVVVHPDGSRISYPRALGRFFAEILSSILYIGYIIAAFDDEKRALHDRICDTRVVFK